MRGTNLDMIRNTAILINESGTIENISKEIEAKDKIPSNRNCEDLSIIDADGFIILPGFINGHTHMGDSIGKDVSSSADLNSRVHPHYSIKKTILDKTPQPQLVQMIRNTILSMINKGVTTFADFREGGLEGVNLLKTALIHSPINGIILGRIDFGLFPAQIQETSSDLEPKTRANFEPKNLKKRKKETQLPPLNSVANNEKRHRLDNFYIKKIQKELATSDKKNSKHFYQDADRSKVVNSAKEILAKSQGFGISGANENTDEMLTIYNQIVTEQKNQKTKVAIADTEIIEKHLPLIAIHAAESIGAVENSLKNYGMTEIQRTLRHLDPDIYIHATNSTDLDLKLLSANKKKIIVCPRANGVLGVGFAPIKRMLELRFELGIGTDNVMLNSPDMFREMDFLLKSQRAKEQDPHYLSAKEVLKMATVNGGKIFGIKRGCIDVGYKADLIFIDKYDLDIFPSFDPCMSIVTRCSEKHVKGVMINGELVLEKTIIR